MEQWITVPDWGRFQHYKNRNPTWIKLYTELNSDPNWCALTLAQRGLLTTVWIEHARSRGRLSTKQLASIAGAGFKHAYLKSLCDAGFIGLVDSRPPAHHAMPEKETDTEEETEQDQEQEPSFSPTVVQDPAAEPDTDPDDDVPLGPPKNGRTEGVAQVFDFQNILQDMPL